MYLPGDNGWTDEDKLAVVGWIGEDVYVDLGDSAVTGGEFSDTLHDVINLKDGGLVFESAGIYRFDRILHIEKRN